MLPHTKERVWCPCVWLCARGGRHHLQFQLLCNGEEGLLLLLLHCAFYFLLLNITLWFTLFPCICSSGQARCLPCLSVHGGGRRCRLRSKRRGVRRIRQPTASSLPSHVATTTHLTPPPADTAATAGASPRLFNGKGHSLAAASALGPLLRHTKGGGRSGCSISFILTISRGGCVWHDPQVCGQP
jgi:hypothetical protein